MVNLSGDNALLTGGYNGVNSFNSHLLFVHDSDSYSNGSVNGIAVVSNVISSTRFQFQSITEYSSNFGPPTNRFSGASGGSWLFQGLLLALSFSQSGAPGAPPAQTFSINSGSRASNVTTLVLALPTGFTSIGIGVGQLIYVNSFSANFSPGVKTVTVAGQNSVSYAEPAADQGTTLNFGTVSINSAPNMLMTPFKAQPSLPNIPGPYIWDPNNGVAITAIESTTTAVINAGQRLTLLNLGSATAFPDQVGFLVFAYGTALQTPPVKYLGRASNTSLLIDYGFAFPANLPAGTKVTFLNNLGGFAPTLPNTVGSFYITPSAAGRVAAQSSILDAAAAGIQVNITIAYPGDRGLGGEGLPTSGAAKVSDAVIVWGSDSLDTELATARAH